MRLFTHFALVCCSLVLLCSAAAAQQIAGSISTREVDGIRAIPNVPFSGTFVTDEVRTLADGSHIRTHTEERVYRDSAGRIRTERPVGAPLGFPAPPPGLPVMIQITDPAAGYSYNLQSQTKRATRMSLQPAVIDRAPALQPPPLPRQEIAEDLRPKSSTEILDPETIEGVLATGQRVTTTYPVNSIGNDAPIARVNERWTSTELGVVVMIKRLDPVAGDTIQRLTNIDQSEPDPALFKIPADYTITELRPLPVAN
jgi:hypothetical protein